MAVASPPIQINDLRPEHWPDIARIYADGIATEHRFVAQRDGAVVGWARVSPVSDRCVYGGVVENSVSVDQQVCGQGVGRLLLERLIASTEQVGIWTIQTGIGRRKRLGKLHGIWRDVLLLERRSDTVE